MKIFLSIIIFIGLGLSSFCQTLTSLSSDTFFQGEIYPTTMTLYGNNIFPVPITQKVYGIYLHNQQNPNFSITIVDSLEFPMQSASTTRHEDSIRIQNHNFIPFNADTGIYDLILIRCNNANPPTTFFYDTLENATIIQVPDGYIYGKTFLDNNYNKVFDVGDSVVTFLNMSLDGNLDVNIRYDSVGNFFFPARNGDHIIGWNFQTEFKLNTDSSFFYLTLNDTNIVDINFGYVPGMLSCTPDTVHQNDTVIFDFLSNGVFLPSDFDYLVFIDSLGNESSIITVGLFNDSVTFLDSSHIVTQNVITNQLGRYSIRAVYYSTFLTYTLADAVVVLPPVSSSIVEMNSDYKVHLFPNPANQSLKIISDFLNENIHYSIVNYIGKIVASGSIKVGQQIPISELPNGMYVLKIIQINRPDKMLKFIKTN